VHRRSAAKVQAARAVERLGLGSRELNVSPAELLLHTNRVAAYDCEVLEGLLGSLELEPGSSGFVKDKDTGELVPMRRELKALWGPTYHLTGVWTGEGKPHPYWEMHEAAQKRAYTISSTCLKLKLKEEASETNRLLAQGFVDAMRGVVQALGHSLTDPAVRTAMRAQLTAISGAQDIIDQ
jgi:hypothetical protein